MRSKTLGALAVTAGTLAAVPAASAAAPPANDAFAAAAPIVSTTESTRSTIDEATLETGEPDHGRAVGLVRLQAHGEPAGRGRVPGRPEHHAHHLRVHGRQRVGAATRRPGPVLPRPRAVRGSRRADVLHRGLDAGRRADRQRLPVPAARHAAAGQRCVRGRQDDPHPGQVPRQRGRRHCRARRGRVPLALAVVPHQAPSHGQADDRHGPRLLRRQHEALHRAPPHEPAQDRRRPADPPDGPSRSGLPPRGRLLLPLAWATSSSSCRTAASRGRASSSRSPRARRWTACAPAGSG